MRSSEATVDGRRSGRPPLDLAGLPGASDGRELALPETILGVLIALQFAPGMLGHCKAPLQLAVACAGIGYMAMRAAAPLRRISLQPVRHLAVVILYLFLAAFIVEPESVPAALRGLLIGGIGLLFIGTLLRAARPRDLLVALVLIHAALAAADLLRLGAHVAGVERLLHVAYLPIKDYPYPAHWTLPWSLAYAQPVAYGGSAFERALGLYREPGVHQAFALTGFCAALLLRDLRWRRTLATVILLGSACTLSTAWFASLGAVIMWLALTRIDLRRVASLAGTLALLLGLAGLAYVANQIPGIGFSDKLAGDSGQDRLRAFEALGPALTLSPWWGLGQDTTLGRSAIQSVSGSLVVGIARLGICGTVLFVVAVAATLFERHDRRSFLLVIPIGVTLIASQPLYYSIAAFFILALPGRAALAAAPPIRRDPPRRAGAYTPSGRSADGEAPLVIVDDP